MKIFSLLALLSFTVIPAAQAEDSATPDNGYAEIHLAIIRNLEEPVLTLLKQDPAAATHLDNNKNSPLHLCASGAYETACTTRVIETLYRLAPETLYATASSGETPLHRAYVSQAPSHWLLLQLISYNPLRAFIACPDLKEIAPLFDPSWAKIDPMSLHQDYILERLDAFLKYVRSPETVPGGDFKWDLFFGGLNLIAKREPRSEIFDRWDDRALLLALESFAHTSASRDTLVKTLLTEKYYAYQGKSDSKNQESVNVIVTEIFRNYAEFLAKMISEHVDVASLERGEASPLNIVYLFRSNIKKRAAVDDPRHAIFSVLVAYLAAQPELITSIVPLEVLYHESHHEEIVQLARPYLDKFYPRAK